MLLFACACCLVPQPGDVFAASFALKLLPPGTPAGPGNDFVGPVVRDINDAGRILRENDIVVPNAHIESYAINNSDQIVGYWGGPPAGPRSFLMKNGTAAPTPVDINVAGPIINTIAAGINNLGQVVGFFRSSTAPERHRGFVRDASGQTSVVEFPGADSTFPSDINDAGVVVGNYRVGSAEFAFVKDGGGYRTLTTPGPYCDADSINNSNVVVGSCSEGAFPNTGKIYSYVKYGLGDDAEIVLLQFASHSTLAMSINNRNQIVGILWNDGDDDNTGFLAEQLARVSLNRGQVLPGDTLTLGVEVQAPGDQGALDAYIGAVFPDGQTIVVFGASGELQGGQLDQLTAFSPTFALEPGQAVANAAFFSYTMTSGQIPSGPYLVFAALLRPGALTDNDLDTGDVVAFDAKTVVVGP